MSSKIEWTDETWNPVTGCEKVSPGCDHCYAETWAARRMGEWSGREFGEVRCHPLRLSIPLGKKKPTRYFVNSMSDLFHKDVPVEFIFDVFSTMAAAERHTFQVLTKRPERMRRVVGQFYRNVSENAPLLNVWAGVSIESNAYAWRADMLRETQAAVRFLSIEPMIGDVDKVDFTGIDWVIVGGESGHGARPMDPRWATDVRDRCIERGIPFFFKQFGEWAPPEVPAGGAVIRWTDDHAFHMSRLGKARSGRVLDGRTWDEFPASIGGAA